MPEHNPGQLGGTMRLGRRRTVFVEEHESITSMCSSALDDWLSYLILVLKVEKNVPLTCKTD